MTGREGEALDRMQPTGEKGAAMRRRFGRAAAQGDAEAQFSLGFLHLRGIGGPVDLVEARRLFGLAAAQG